MKKIFFLSIIVILFSSCNQKYFYEDYVEIPEKNWDVNDVVSFSFEIEDVTVPYNLYINIRHGNLYPYRNIWLFVHTTAPNGSVQKDSVNCILADDNNRWKGECLVDICDYLSPFMDSIAFIEPGVYVVEIQHALRQDKAPLIHEIGFVVDKLE